MVYNEVLTNVEIDLTKVEVIDIPKPKQSKSVVPTTDKQNIVPDEGKELVEVIVEGVTAAIDENITPENIRLGTEVLGVKGNLAPDKPDQEKTIYPSEEEQVVVADLGYELAKVIAKPVETESFDIAPSTSEQVVKASDGKYIKEVVVGAIEDIDPEIAEQGTMLDSLAEEVNALEGAPKTDGEYFVKVIDYDGTILKEATLDAGDIFTLPNAPSHDGLIFQEWSCSQEIVDNTITLNDNNVMVGAIYATASGLSEFDIDLTKAIGLDVTLNMDGTKDWGDGTSDDLTTHTYSNYGEYTIKCNGTNITTSSSSGIFGQSSSNINYCCKNARLTGISEIGDYAFYNCKALERVIFSNELTIIGEYLFQNCVRLRSMVVPNNVVDFGYSTFIGCYCIENIVLPSTLTKIGGSMCANCYSLTHVVLPTGMIDLNGSDMFRDSSLESIVIPSTITKVSSYMFQRCYNIKNIKFLANVEFTGMSAFYNCRALKHIELSDSITSISSSSFEYCNSLEHIIMPKQLSTIGSSAFSTCGSAKIYDFRKVQKVPKLSNINAFSYFNNNVKMIVPDNLYDEWIIATNWTNYADYIYKASEVQL